MFYATAEGHPGLPHDPFKAIVAPRPIGWISTIDETGMHNLAPYSFFSAIASKPPMVLFSSEGWKDTVAACAQTGEFVVNLATYDLKDAMNASSAPLARDRSEFPHAGLTPAPCRLVRAPRVLEAAASLECKVLEIFSPKTLDGEPIENHMVIGQVVGVHIAERCLTDGRFDMVKAGTIARCGWDEYLGMDGVFRMGRPKGA
ncbi:flavin reductase family protein [Pinisolibacter aquiterrae]|uniref:flavin reductase family protein n=1 Tax=Pinisolibacter aquiterrae TaxID=2815579 RepID=UPI001C3DDCA4|nr:flavin reductase family protein [Pinisolibacter aquiterrae]MBV5264103.1 flavin reductase family protein [Pinisolibacter aquiterrae]MCC8233802.1 flavin reductase family protein [Pinisolibacter aquiterrae]